MKRFHKTLLAAACTLALTAGFAALLRPAQAQTPAKAPSLIKTCNLVSVFNKLDMKSAGDDEIKGIDAKLNGDLKKAEDELQRLNEERREFRDSEEAKRTEEKILKQAADIESMRRFAEQRLLMEQRVRTVAIYRAILKGIEDYSKDNGIALVLMVDEPDIRGARSQGELLSKISLRKVLYADPSMDITRELIEKLNAEYARNKKPKP